MSTTTEETAAAQPAAPGRLHTVRRVLRFTCTLLVVAEIGFTVMRVFGLERTWYGTVLVAYTPWIALGSAVPLLFALVLRRWRTSAVAALTCVALATLFLARAVGSPDPGPGPVIRVMNVNMKIGSADPAQIVALARANQVDILTIEEFTDSAQTALRAAGLAALLPYAVEAPDTAASGSAVFSRFPVRDTGFHTLAGGFHQAYATLAVPGAQPLEVIAVHARAPVDPDFQAAWATSLGQEPPATPHGAVRLLMGDFNATLDHARLRTLLDTGYHDVASQLGDGMVTTWPYDGRPVPAITLDHIFADPRIGAVRFDTHAVRGTDHRAVIATLTLPVS
jgi:endonuclease/exonuclease/phosphatase (EEP) superfamily protein YafD